MQTMVSDTDETPMRYYHKRGVTAPPTSLADGRTSIPVSFP